jgi:hypothetical protein
MSWTTNIVLWCDTAQCGQSWEARNATTVEQAREQATRDGWETQKGNDRCSLHRSIPLTFEEILRG